VRQAESFFWLSEAGLFAPKPAADVAAAAGEEVGKMRRAAPGFFERGLTAKIL
jgi:hypothetical protein